MRIISGTHKGRRLQAPKHLPVRPTTDMAKEALFNILHNTYLFEELAVLDLYSGLFQPLKAGLQNSSGKRRRPLTSSLPTPHTTSL